MQRIGTISSLIVDEIVMADVRFLFLRGHRTHAFDREWRVGRGRSQAKLAVAEIETKVHSLVDLLKQVVTLDSEILALTHMEYRLLAVLEKHAGEVVPQPILSMLTPLVDVHLWRLRKNLGKYANQYIGTVTEIGYRFRPFQPRS